MAENTENGSANTKIGEGFGRIAEKNQKTSLKNRPTRDLLAPPVSPIPSGSRSKRMQVHAE